MICWGMAERSKATASKADAPEGAIAGPNPAAPANIYIDNETGREVHEDWWPGDPYPEETK